MTAIDFTRWYLALFFVGVAAFYSVRVVVAKRRTGVSPVFAGPPGSAHFAAHVTFRTFRALILVVCVVRLLWPSFDRYLIVFHSLWQPAVLMSGNALLFAGFSCVLVIHFYMGEHWRSGTRADDRTGLITTGPFAVSRNPMMLCVIVAQVGLFLALPSVFTLVCLIVGAWAVRTQIGVEERLLRQRLGADYDAYAARTPRWLSIRKITGGHVVRQARGGGRTAN